MPINKSKSISACIFSFKLEGLSLFDKFFLNAQFLHFRRAPEVDLRDGSLITQNLG